MSPRAFERPATISLPDGAVPGEPGASLEGLYVPAPDDDASGALVAAPHPMMGGNMDHPVVTEIAHACADRAAASLRFNWRGVGASAGEPSGDTAVADVDIRAAHDFLFESVRGAIFACGYSFGAAGVVRALAGRPRVKRLILVAPPPVMLEREALERHRGKTLVICGDRDAFVPTDALEKSFEGLPDTTVEIVPDTDHFFSATTPAISKIVRDWLSDT